MVEPLQERQPPTTTITIDHQAAVRALAKLLDTSLVVPGTNIRFGLDAILGLLPGIGDTISAAAGSYIIYAAHQVGVPKRVLARMLANLGIDTVIGSIPFAGTIFDVAYKSNVRNAALLEQAVIDPQAAKRGSTWALVAVGVLFLGCVAGTVALTWLLLNYVSIKVG